jgi:pimeloyl-ACP methyl ester carboxylesterase
MTAIYKSSEGEQLVKEKYRQFLAYWPLANTQFHLSTSQGDTFVIACGPEGAPALVLLHGSAFNSVTWMGDVVTWASHFRVYAIDVIGQPNLSAPSRPAYDSESYARWLDDVMNGLNLKKATFIGISLGGWLALDYAIRRGDRVACLVLLCPGGVGREKNSMLKLVFVILPLLLLGDWGRRKATAMMLGASLAPQSEATRAVGDFMALIFKHFRPNLAKVRRFSDAELQSLTMPVLTILGAKDAMIDSEETLQRLQATVSNLQVEWLPEASHMLIGQAQVIDEYLAGKLL